jgi:succinate dehydrogenase / fumarate reductase membrane anchor subunit
LDLKETGMDAFRTPLKKVRGLGSAKAGTDHWWMQRVTAVAVAVLGVWLVVLLGTVGDSSYETMRQIFAHPVTATLSIALALSLYYHGYLGLQVVIEDYVHHRPTEVTLMILLRFAAVLAALVTTIAGLKLVFAG